MPRFNDNRKLILQLAFVVFIVGMHARITRHETSRTVEVAQGCLDFLRFGNSAASDEPIAFSRVKTW